MPNRKIETLTSELKEALRIDYLDRFKNRDSDMTDSNETSPATFESIGLDIGVIHFLLEKYIDGDPSGCFLGGPDSREVELSDLILKSDNLRANREDQSLFNMFDSVAYLASQLAMACYDDWEENFDDGEWRLQAMRAVCADKDFTSTRKPWDD